MLRKVKNIIIISIRNSQHKKEDKQFLGYGVRRGGGGGGVSQQRNGSCVFSSNTAFSGDKNGHKGDMFPCFFYKREQLLLHPICFRR